VVGIGNTCTHVLDVVGKQWLKCTGTQGNAVPHLQFLAQSVPPTSDRYNVRERHTTIVRGPNLNVAFPHL